MVGKLTMEDFRLVLLICSTIELPKFILWQFLLNFLVAVRTICTQKERAR